MRSEKEERARQQDKQKLKRQREEGEGRIPDLSMAIKSKRSKLVLSDPQMKENELQQVIKMAKASESARELAEESGDAGDALLGEYTPLTPATAMTARTPAAQDVIKARAQDLMALTHVDTPLKGGLNTPLNEVQSLGPHTAAPQTPNTLLSTPFRTPALGDSTPSVRSVSAAGSATPGSLRDQLSINAEGALVPANSEKALKQYQKSIRSSLKESLSSLPESTNNYDIVVPDDDPEHLRDISSGESIMEDQSDVDARREADAEAARVAALKKRSQTCTERYASPSHC